MSSSVPEFRARPEDIAAADRLIGDLDVAVALVRGSAEGPAKEGKRRILYRRGVTLKETRDDIAHWLGAALAWLEDHPTASDLTSRDERWTAAIGGYVRVCDALDRARTVL